MDARIKSWHDVRSRGFVAVPSTARTLPDSRGLDPGIHAVPHAPAEPVWHNWGITRVGQRQPDRVDAKVKPWHDVPSYSSFRVRSNKTQALALYRRFGFTTEGTHVAYAFRDGQFVDSHAMARLNPR